MKTNKKIIISFSVEKKSQYENGLIDILLPPIHNGIKLCVFAFSFMYVQLSSVPEFSHEHTAATRLPIRKWLN